MTSYAHDADVIVFNYDARSPSSVLGMSNTMSTTKVSLRDAIISIQCNKTKSSPQGSFSISLKPTQDWAQVIVPGSWCAIFMSDRKLTSEDYTASASLVTVNANNSSVDNVISPLKMIGMIMGVRVQKQRNGDGAFVVNYSVSGYDFGYVFTSQIYINHLFQEFVGTGKLMASFANVAYPVDSDIFGDPATNVNRVLNAWSTFSQSGLPFSPESKIKPPSVRLQIPDDVAELFGTGTEVLQFIGAGIGIDNRTEKVMSLDDNGKASEFDPKLLGEKGFWIWKLILHNTLWGMINEYLNPLMNEAYCDLHPVRSSNPIAKLNPLSTSATLAPMLIVRQIPFSTPNYKKIWIETLGVAAAAKQPFPVTKLNELPRTAIPTDKVLSFDIGYSDYDRTNFVEINGFLINGPKNGIDSGPFNAANPPAYNEESIKRLGLRPKIIMGADYGVTRDKLETAGLWRPLLVDWWFNANKFANGTVECIGLSEHIALGENIELVNEGILGHIESYTHTFTVDSNTGNKIFRTSIEFVKGISSDSTSLAYKYVYGELDAPGVGFSAISNALGNQESIVTDDIQKRVSFTSNGDKGLDVK